MAALVLIAGLGTAAAAMRDAWLPFVQVRWAATDVRLLDGGAEPRQLMRYAHSQAARPFEAVTQETLLRFHGVMQGEESHAPAVAWHWEPVRAVARFGVSRTVWKIAATSVLPDAEVDAPVAASARENAQGLVGGEWTIYVGPSGQLRVDPPVTDAAAATVDRLRRLLELMLAPPLPDAPVGKGARWEARRSTALGLAANADQVTTFTVVDISDVGLDLEATGRFSGQAQRPSPTVVVDEIEGDYAGRLVLLVNEATPVQSELAFRVGMAAVEVAGDAAPTDDERQRGQKIVWRGRTLLQASAVGELQW